MHLLPNNCKCSDICVSPKNWKSTSKTNKTWLVYYRFYDPILCPGGKMFQYRAANSIKNADDRRRIVESMIYELEDQLFNQGFNPISHAIIPPTYNKSEVDPQTPFVVAIAMALEKIKAVPGTLSDMKTVVKGVTRSAAALNFERIPIGKVTRKYIKQILEYLAVNNKRYNPITKKQELYWSANRHNKYRTYLMRIFKELIEMEAVDVNPVRDISKMKITVRQRVLPTEDQRREIDIYLKANYYSFWRMVHIFFHSGARETELMQVQAKHVDLVNQRCLYTVKKGQDIREIYRPIKDVILPLWKEVLDKCDNAEHYLFSRNLEPGEKAIRPEQFSRRWTLHVKGKSRFTRKENSRKKHIGPSKEKLNIDVDLYTLKHLNSTESMEVLSKMYNYDPSADVAKQNGHTSTSMLRKVYDVRYVERENDRLKKVDNKFG